MKKHLPLLFAYFLLFIVTSARSQKNLQLFPLNDVQLLLSPFYTAQQTDLKYILEMDADKLLAPYLREAGLTPKADSYTNWENTGLDGHIGGHYISALAMMYAATGNEEIKTRLEYMIKELKRCQDVVGTGFIGGTPGSNQLWDEIKNGDIRAGAFNLNAKWVPLYNIHKVYAGLRDAYLFADNNESLDMLIKLTDWMIYITSGLSDEQMQDMLRSEHGGLNEVFADVAELTGDNKYLKLAKRFSHHAILEPLLNNQDKLTGLHANTQIPKVIGYKRIADLEDNSEWDNAARFFWQTVTDNRSISIGGNSVREHFHPADNFEPMILDVEGPETCNTYNMLRLSNMLFLTTGDKKYVDYYERALYNHILSSQEPDKGGFVYFTSMRPGHYRVYSQPHTSMWCCVGSGLENHTKYGEMIYVHSENELYVNLFIPSRVNWKEKGVKLVQETFFPDEEQVILRIEEVKNPFSLKIRCPDWVVDSGEITLLVNGKKVNSFREPESGYICVDRKWKRGDEVKVNFPMSLIAEQLPDKSDYYSFKYGPVVLAAKLGTEDLRGLYADDSRGGHIAHGRQIPLQEIPVLVGENNQLLSDFQKDQGKLSFIYTGTTYPEKSLTFIPFFRLHNARYAVYFRQVTAGGVETMKEEVTRREQAAAELAGRTVDLIYPGEQQPESDHFIQYEDSQTGIRDNRHFRTAKGWFSYQLTAEDKAKSIVLVRHKKDQNPETLIIVNGIEISSVPETVDLDENFESVTYSLPRELDAGKHEIKFMPKDSESRTTRIYEVRLIK